MLPKRKNYVFVRFFFGEKNLRRRIFQHNLFLHFGKKKRRIEICFVFEKTTKMRIQRREVSTIESTNTEFLFLQQKEDVVFPFFKGVFYIVKNRHWKMAWRESFQKRCYQKKKGEKKVVKMRRHWSGSAPKSQFTQHNSH